MELIVSKNILMDGIQTVQNAISQKNSLPILNNVLIEAENGKIKLTTTDLEIGICATIDATVTQAGSTTVPARKFFDIIKSLPDGSDISMAMKKNNFIMIKTGKAQFRIVGLPKEEFPRLPLFKDKDSITIQQHALKEMLNLTDFAVSKDDTRYVLNGILFEIKEDRINMVATDGRRLAMINTRLPQKTLVDIKVVVPTKTIQEVKRMLSDDGEVTVKFGENQVLFVFKDSFIISRLIEGEYPNYKNVIPARSTSGVKVSREDFLSAARRASIFTDQDSLAVKLSIKKKKMTISKNTPYLGEAKEELDVDFSGQEEFEIGFNPRYLIDVLRSLSEEEITLELEDAAKPGVVRRGEGYTYVVLPMQLTR